MGTAKGDGVDSFRLYVGYGWGTDSTVARREGITEGGEGNFFIDGRLCRVWAEA